jgi:signal transduction histidine kinase
MARPSRAPRGLAIAQTIAERHAATLALTQADGGGMLATVTFPAGI